MIPLTLEFPNQKRMNLTHPLKKIVILNKFGIIQDVDIVNNFQFYKSVTNLNKIFFPLISKKCHEATKVYFIGIIIKCKCKRLMGMM